MKKLVICLSILLCVGSANADQLFGDFKRLPDDIERGFSFSADFGMLMMTGQKRTIANPGYQLSLNMGVDIMKYLSIESINTLGILEASPFDTILEGGVNTFLHNLALKLQYPLGRAYPFLEIGGGIFYSKPEFNFDGDGWYKWNMVIGGGIEYYTFLRHYSLYAKGLYHMILDAPIDMWGVSGGIKYTF